MGNELKSIVLASQIAQWCNLDWQGEDCPIQKITPLSAPEKGALCFANKTPAERLPEGVVLIGSEDALSMTSCLLQTDKPRLTFAKVLVELSRRIGFKNPDAMPVIHPTAQVSPQAFVGSGVVIGARTVVLPFAYIGDGTVIGNDCIVKSGAVIGQDGFGFERDENGLPVRLVHLGNVIIGNDVEIGSGTTVCRGTLSNTLIKDHAKIDDHVHIAHNVTVGMGAMVIACAEVSGGVVLGDRSWVGPNASIIQKIVIGNDALIGIAANVLKNVPDGTIMVGNPAKPLNK